jgi:hypothetical protein
MDVQLQALPRLLLLPSSVLRRGEAGHPPWKPCSVLYAHWESLRCKRVNMHDTLPTS